MSPIWIEGTTRTGKTTRLIQQFSDFFDSHNSAFTLVFAANNQNRHQLADKLAQKIKGKSAIICKTPLGFFQDEITLFWPLLCQELQIKAQFLICLRPETEQELATKLWQNQLKNAELPGLNRERLVRNILDLLQLAGASGVKLDQIPTRLEHGLGIFQLSPEHNYRQIYAEWGKMIENWASWCLNHGFVTYGLIYYLYDQFLLPNVLYQQYLSEKYEAIFADDLDDYPAIARHFFEFLLDNSKFGVFTYNPNGQIRLGINADPEYLKNIANRCKIEKLREDRPLIDTAVKLLTNFDYNDSLPDSIVQIKAITRATLLRKVSQFIVDSVSKGDLAAGEIAIIAPGLDAIARYSLLEILSSQGVPITPLNEQRPLVSYAHIRALLTLLCLIYPNLAHLAPPDTVREMLIILSQKPDQNGNLIAEIDPVRAGLLIDHCQPLLDFETNFPRWDRLGYKASRVYQEICQWLKETKNLQEKTTPLNILDKAIKDFYDNGKYFNSAELSALRELMETAQHYWEVNQRQGENGEIVGNFVQLLQREAITSNPRPVGIFGKSKDSITLATVFQYRQERTCHRWLFLLDTNSRLWEKGGAANLFAAPIFLQNWDGKPLTPEDNEKMNEERLIRIIKDLLSRSTEKVYLCHSFLDINGSEQIAGLSPLIYAAKDYQEFQDFQD